LPPAVTPQGNSRKAIVTMANARNIFGINTYSYTMSSTAAETIRRLGGRGYPAFELMMYEGHLWPNELDDTKKRDVRNAVSGTGTRIISCNMPNIDVNIAGVTKAVAFPSDVAAAVTHLQIGSQEDEYLSAWHDQVV
jgi:hypothetical protein